MVTEFVTLFTITKHFRCITAKSTPIDNFNKVKVLKLKHRQ